ncbi:MAG: hypothetical protein AAGJ37_11760 [Pseudomonadota bacterium]
MKGTAIVGILLCLLTSAVQANTISSDVTGTSSQKPSSPLGQLPAVPTANGFGVYTRPAQDADIYRVTNLESRGPGSLENCINGKGKRVCVFEVAGRIDYGTANFNINNDDVHIAGQTAPFPGIVVQSPRNIVSADNVVIEHIRFMSNDKHTNQNLNSSKGYDTRDTLAIENANNVFLNHVTLTFGIDGTLDVSRKVDNLTVRNSIIALGLNYSIHAVRGKWKNLNAHAFLSLIGHQTINVDITRSIIAYGEGRIPRSGAKNFYYAENVNFGTQRDRFVDLYTRNGTGFNTDINVNILGNVFITDRESQNTVELRPGSNGTVNMHYKKNALLLKNGETKQLPEASSTIKTDLSEGEYMLKNTPIASAIPYGVSVPSKPVTENEVLSLAGAFPAHRIPLEKEIISNIKSRSGEIINCYTETGDTRFQIVLAGGPGYPEPDAPSAKDRCKLTEKGWPGWRKWLLSTSVITRRSLDDKLPNEPNAILPSGYTRLEAFLHACSRKVELNQGECNASQIDEKGQG